MKKIIFTIFLLLISTFLLLILVGGALGFLDFSNTIYMYYTIPKGIHATDYSRIAHPEILRLFIYSILIVMYFIVKTGKYKSIIKILFTCLLVFFGYAYVRLFAYEKNSIIAFITFPFLLLYLLKICYKYIQNGLGKDNKKIGIKDVIFIVFGIELLMYYLRFSFVPGLGF